MILFDENNIDVEETIKVTKRFMNRTLPKVMTSAEVSYVDVKSPVVSGMPSGISYGNSSDEKVTMHMQAKLDLQKILRAISSLDSDSRLILELKYLKDKRWWEIENEMHWGKTKASEILNDALVAFAWSMNYVDKDVKLLVFDK